MSTRWNQVCSFLGWFHSNNRDDLFHLVETLRNLWPGTFRVDPATILMVLQCNPNILLKEEILHPLIGSLSHHLQGLYIPDGCLGFQPSTVPYHLKQGLLLGVKFFTVPKISLSTLSTWILAPICCYKTDGSDPSSRRTGPRMNISPWDDRCRIPRNWAESIPVIPSGGTSSRGCKWGWS